MTGGVGASLVEGRAEDSSSVCNWMGMSVSVLMEGGRSVETL